MLAMGVHPSVSSATTACMLLYTSFSATTSFAVFGLLDNNYAPGLFAMGFTSTLFGQIVMGYLLRRTNRQSFIAFSVGIVVALATVCMTVQSILSMGSGGSTGGMGICTTVEYFEDTDIS